MGRVGEGDRLGRQACKDGGERGGDALFSRSRGRGREEQGHVKSMFSE